MVKIKDRFYEAALSVNNDQSVYLEFAGELPMYTMGEVFDVEQYEGEMLSVRYTHRAVSAAGENTITMALLPEEISDTELLLELAADHEERICLLELFGGAE